MGMFRYKIKVICDNCGTTHEIKIPNGVLIRDFLKSGKGKCVYCKCNKFSKFYKNKSEQPDINDKLPYPKG
jgi:hypothetical protein